MTSVLSVVSKKVLPSEGAGATAAQEAAVDERATAQEQATEQRVAELVAGEVNGIHRRTDRLFAGLLLFEWLAAVAVAYWVSPWAWAGVESRVHPHVWGALLVGGLIVSLLLVLVAFYPGRGWTRHSIAAAQMLMSALLIHLTGGRIETHFHVFGSLAFLAFYRDWRVLITASAVVALDHMVRGWVWPESVYGTSVEAEWR